MDTPNTFPLTISFPPDVQAFVQSQVAAGGYRSAGEYIERLVDADRREKNKEQLERYLIEGLDSGGAVEWDHAELEKIRHEVHERLKARRRS